LTFVNDTRQQNDDRIDENNDLRICCRCFIKFFFIVKFFKKNVHDRNFRKFNYISSKFQIQIIVNEKQLRKYRHHDRFRISYNDFDEIKWFFMFANIFHDIFFFRYYRQRREKRFFSSF
jgi:hypothetical protein